VKDWTLIAKANGLAIPAAELERVAKTLDALEAIFRPLTASLPATLEPAAVFDPLAGPQ